MDRMKYLGVCMRLAEIKLRKQESKQAIADALNAIQELLDENAGMRINMNLGHPYDGYNRFRR
jgi:hypothetical protein